MKVKVGISTLGLSFVFIFINISFAFPLYVGSTDLLTAGNGWTLSQPHQDTIGNVNWLVDYYDGTVNNASSIPYPLTLLGKWEVDENDWDDDNPGFTGDFSGTSGDWMAPMGWSAPLYYSIKAGSANSGGGFELYYANGDVTGTWNTSGLSNSNSSHISFWTATTSNPVVPEPSTIILFGLGILGLVGVNRRKE